jgi:hypothetical protein
MIMQPAETFDRSGQFGPAIHLVFGSQPVDLSLGRPVVPGRCRDGAPRYLIIESGQEPMAETEPTIGETDAQ